MRYNCNTRVLVVDDEESILQFLELGLKNQDFQVQAAKDGIDAIAKARQFQPHVVILDVMMPGMDGFEVCDLLTKIDKISIIMLTAKEEVDERVKALNLGADDYMIKPFSFKELVARIQARVRNVHPELLNEIIRGPFRIDDSFREIRFQDKLLQLSKTEYDLLKFLVMSDGAVVSKTAILDEVWGYDFGGEENIVEVYVRSLRDKLKDREHQLIRTIRGSGYRVNLS